MPRLRVIDDEAIERPFDKRQFLRLLSFLKPYRGRVAFSLVLMVISAVCSLMLPMLMSRAIDQIDQGNSRNFPFFLIAMVLCAALGAICVRYRARIMDTAGRSAIADMRQTLFNHIQDLSFNFFDSRSAGKIMVRVINDVNSLNDLFTNGIVNVFIDCVTLVLLLTLMLVVNWKLTLISMCILPFLLLILFGLKRRMRKNWQTVRAKISNMNGYLHESLSGMRVTEAFTRENENASIFEDTNDDIRSSWMRAIKLNNLFWPSLDTVSAIGTVLVYIFGVAMLGGNVAAGQISLVVHEAAPAQSEAGVECAIYMAFAKADKFEHVIQKATELGAGEIVAFPSSRCVARLDEKTLAKKLERWQKIAASAAEQSGRGRIPQVRAVRSFREAVLEAAERELALFPYENEKTQSLRACLSAGGYQSVSIMTGPEGGFSEEEVAFAGQNGMKICSLGPRILRCETAPLCALSAVMYQAGEF